MSTVNNELTCKFCTFINERGSTICNACGRSLGLPSVNLNPSGIACIQCTFQNPYGSVNCTMCGYIITKAEQVGTADVSMEVGQLCQICFSNMTVDAEFKMPGCTHIFCTGCAKQYFTIKIMECGINNFRCPIDVCVSFDELQNKSDFFRDLKLVLQNVLDENTTKVFTSKVGILDIMDKPGFLRCSLCNHGFISQLKGKMFTCPACSKVFCSKCGKKWTSGHSQVNCKPNQNRITAEDDLEMYTNANCPQCKYKYFLERGGCMHITCSQCSHEYCEFCFKKITGKGKSCAFPNCPKGQSLHAHHPRNCMYYVQEMDHEKLEQLLKMNGVRSTLVQSRKTKVCAIKVNVSIGETWMDSECKEPALQEYNYMCIRHYKWHLGELMKKHQIDPVDAMNNKECLCELNRNNVKVQQLKLNYNLPIEDADTPGLRALVRVNIPFSEI